MNKVKQAPSTPLSANHSLASDNKLEVIIRNPPKAIDEPDTEHDPNTTI